MVRFFSPEPDVVEVGADFLRIISLNFFAMGIVWTCSSVFQGLGNTLPSLASSAMRLVTFAVPAVWISMQPGFHLVHDLVRLGRHGAAAGGYRASGSCCASSTESSIGVRPPT